MTRILPLALVALCAFSARPDCRVPYFQALSSRPFLANAVAAAELNGDARPDAVLTTAGAVAVALNDGSGKLLEPVTVYTGTITGNVLARDFDGNGTTDLGIPTSAGLSILPGAGDGSFGAAATSALPLTTPRLAAARFDLGNTLDLAAIDQAAPLLLILANRGPMEETSRITLRANPLALTAADFDADGSTDVLVSYGTGSVYDLFYGRPDGTFDARTVQGRTSTMTLQAADLNRDGLLEIIAAAGGQMVLFRNLGSRTFGDPLSYQSTGSTQTFDVGELNGDDLPDVLAAPRYNSCSFEPFMSSGIVTFGAPWRFTTNTYCTYPQSSNTAAIADFDGDGRNDALLSTTYEYGPEPASIHVYRNICGEGQLLFRPASAVVSLGQPASFDVDVRGPAGEQFIIFGTGTVTLREGEAVRGTATLANGHATISVTGLAVGEHTFTVTHEGDEQYEPKTSPPVTIRVTPETTTTTLEITPAKGVYGVSPSIKVTVKSSDGTIPTGPIRIALDGYSNYQEITAPTGTISGPSGLGTYTYKAEYKGDATHPPSSSNTVQYVISKQTPRFVTNPHSATAGQPVDLLVQVAYSGHSIPPPQGSVTLTVGSFTATQELPGYSSYVSFNLPAMAAGRHFVKLSYPGDDYFTSAEALVPFMVFSPSDAAIDARGTGGAVVVTWQAPASLRIVRRKLPSEQWGYTNGGMCCGPPPWVDTGALPETVYQYRMEDDARTAWSTTDIGMRISFTDDVLLPRTTIKAVHMQELVRATNIVRSAAGLPPLSLNITKGMTIAAAHVATLRASIQQARTALGAAPFPFTETIAASVPIRAAHIQELREAIR